MKRISKLLACLWVGAAALAWSSPALAETGAWTPGSSPPDVLENGVVAGLPNGDVILAGGILSAGHNTAASAEVEVYDPRQDTWGRLPSMPAPQYSATAVALADGSLLVVGGLATVGTTPFSSVPIVSNAVLFQTTSSSWAKLPALPYAETGATATLLSDDRVLVAGGADANGAVKSATIFDPGRRTWTATSPMLTARTGAAAVLLKDGNVLVAGGAAGPGQPLRDAELYDPVKGTRSGAGSMAEPRTQPAALVLPDGRALLAGGMGLTGTSSAEFYDPSAKSWQVTTSSPNSGQGQAFLLASGDVLTLLFAGTTRTVHSALFNIHTTFWAAGPDLRVTAPYPPAAVQLPDKTVLVLNGSTVASFGNAEAPPPNAVAIATKTAGSPQTTLWLLLLFGVLVVVLVIVYLWQRSRRRDPIAETSSPREDHDVSVRARR